MTLDLDGRIVVFAGPSLPSHVRPTDRIFAWMPPAVAGDACALEGARPRAAVLIDGLFDSLPAIRHKELLTLMARGIPLIGGASMGALRAAELHPFGMIGVGRIFTAFAEGRLIGDDEVAVLHAPAEQGWAPLTEALVNVRATLLRAVRAGLVEAAVGRRILAVASGIFYQDRTWAYLSETLEQAAVVSSDLAARLASARVDLKQIDALACLERSLRLDRTHAQARAFPPPTVFAGYIAEQVSKGVKSRPRLVELR
ncbi:MAG TPA: TfuA domain-containing protein [Caulobacteraceae bacterium]